MQIALVNPQIPQNTGSIARTCAATGTRLNIIGDTPFEISEKRVKRAGLDYWPWVNLERHSSWDMFIQKEEPGKCWYFSKFGTLEHWEASYSPDDILVFGSETKGLGEEFISKVDPQKVVRIPMSCEHVRSLNLSNAVSIGLYEALRQTRNC